MQHSRCPGADAEGMVFNVPGKPLLAFASLCLHSVAKLLCKKNQNFQEVAGHESLLLHTRVKLGWKKSTTGGFVCGLGTVLMLTRFEKGLKKGAFRASQGVTVMVLSSEKGTRDAPAQRALHGAPPRERKSESERGRPGETVVVKTASGQTETAALHAMPAPIQEVASGQPAKPVSAFANGNGVMLTNGHGVHQNGHQNGTGATLPGA
eukprot:scaffold239989_cov14-Tisochrysis_lutea.AAC.1